MWSLSMCVPFAYRSGENLILLPHLKHGWMLDKNHDQKPLQVKVISPPPPNNQKDRLPQSHLRIDILASSVDPNTLCPTVFTIIVFICIDCLQVILHNTIYRYAAPLPESVQVRKKWKMTREVRDNSYRVRHMRQPTIPPKWRVEKKSDTASWTGSNVAANQKKW